ncbi:MAG: FixH family protein [Saprospiraceae bacterium]
MKFTFNWGTGIFLTYTIFALALFFTVYKSTQYDNSLVVDDYYAKDLAYQEQYDRLQNSALLPEKVKLGWASAEKKVTLDFPDDLAANVAGTAFFYRPDNKSLDWSVPLRVDAEGLQTIDLSKSPAGRWKLQCAWEADGKTYFDERIIDVK